MRKVLALFLVAIVLAFACGCGGTDEFDPWDKLDGGKEGTDVTESTEVVDDYLIDEITDVDNNANYDENNCYKIDLNSLSTLDFTNITAYSYKKYKLTIKAGGVYVLTGELNGAVTVEGVEEDVQLVLAGVTINTKEDQDCAAIVFKKPDDVIYNRILTIKDGTQNCLSDSSGDNATDGDGAVIQAKKRSLIINGNGSLELTCKGAETSGIKVKTSLTVDGTTIKVISATKSGIKADEQVIIKNANVTVNAAVDGIKTDIEPADETEVKKYSSNSKYGYVYVENSNIDITSGDDGIVANNCLYIANTDKNTIKITTNNGAPSQVTEMSSDSADGKAFKTSGIEDENENFYSAGYKENYGLIITGGKFEINSNDDAFHSKGNLIITGGTFSVSTGDDAFHAEYLTKIAGGNITVNKSYEGIEGATVEITGGTINVNASDDGINAANKDLVDYSFYILISGGNTVVNAEGDGVDSNGTIKITGGTLLVYGPTNGGDAALDADSGIIITGGDVCAVGSVGMVENPSSSSTQCYINLTLNSAVSANTTITVCDSEEKTLLEVSPNKRYQSIIISLSSFVKGNTYTITVGNNTYTATLDNIGTALGMNSQGHGNQGFMPGGKPGGMFGRK